MKMIRATHRYRFRAKRFVRKSGLAIANLFLGLAGKRLLRADCNARYHVWLDGKKRDDVWRTLVSRKAGVEGRGWMDIYLRDVKGNLILGYHGLASVRKYGLVRWEEL